MMSSAFIPSQSAATPFRLPLQPPLKRMLVTTWFSSMSNLLFHNVFLQIFRFLCNIRMFGNFVCPSRLGFFSFIITRFSHFLKYFFEIFRENTVFIKCLQVSCALFCRFILHFYGAYDILNDAWCAMKPEIAA